MLRILKVLALLGCLIPGVSLAEKMTAETLQYSGSWHLVATETMNWGPNHQVLITFWKSDDATGLIRCHQHFDKKMELTRSYCQ